MRLSIESSERPGPDADPRIHVARTLSFLNLIDLAGSESARVCTYNKQAPSKLQSYADVPIHSREVCSASHPMISLHG